ncbi:gamma-glutamylcyclotransferase family protein [Mucilaginibacter auburnensis]|uniref:Gamma-glutamylcyclotransferase (GGCT)/AIG2-like uncharacterized protein YtfP n=1 Tax=Mucilaginibacter auburnensis TaxID=1457233 RepID=A0A2H9VVV9_9SPHI|nr:gamma-glutamylcyclotransferase family protein [Mucilaginibacter auburnensis]PJJ84973.1 gamma-glutamylcyclotransferase (GGCT)/AIG2-like uncharacterized protein YtfP [Mucilaginibacter auburnensis]
MTDLLFIYGSLMDSQNEFGLYLQRNAVLIDEGFAIGKLYDIGEYPGAILDNEGYQLKGKIYQLNNIETNLRVLDDYEGYGDDQLQPNLFIRRLFEIETQSGHLKCWIYLYNLPVDGLIEITSGNYFAYRQHK